MRSAVRALHERILRRRIARSQFALKPGYVSRGEPEYFDDAGVDRFGVVHQPHVYPFAAHVARGHGTNKLIDLGCGRAEKLAALSPEFELFGVDHGRNLDLARDHSPAVNLCDFDLERSAEVPLPEAARGGAILCVDVIEHLRNPMPLLLNLKRLLEDIPFAVLSTPERDLARGTNHMGPPDNPHHVREWNLAELEQLLEAAGLRVLFIGLTASNDDGYPKRTTLAVLERRDGPAPDRVQAATGFRVVAFVPTFNEADVVESTISALTDDGIEVYVIDNWSTDETFSIVKRLQGRGVVGAERFPANRPGAEFDWASIVERTEELALELDADWYMHVDADERRRSPWPGVTMRDAVYAVDRRGFNCIDHTVLDFLPIDDDFPSGKDLENYFRHFRFGGRPGHFLQVKAWKNVGLRVKRAHFHAHDTVFEGRRVFPYKFLNKHYPIRSSAHGIRKVFDERLPRYPSADVARGIHAHYQGLKRDHAFVCEADELLLFDEAEFSREFLVERLTGVGIPREGVHA